MRLTRRWLTLRRHLPCCSCRRHPPCCCSCRRHRDFSPLCIRRRCENSAGSGASPAGMLGMWASEEDGSPHSLPHVSICLELPWFAKGVFLGQPLFTSPVHPIDSSGLEFACLRLHGRTVGSHVDPFIADEGNDRSSDLHPGGCTPLSWHGCPLSGAFAGDFMVREVIILFTMVAAIVIPW